MEKGLTQVFTKLDRLLSARKPLLYLEVKPADPDWIKSLPQPVPIWRKTVFTLDNSILTTRFALLVCPFAALQCYAHQTQQGLSLYIVEPPHDFKEQPIDLQVDLAGYLNTTNIRIFCISKIGEFEEILTPPL